MEAQERMGRLLNEDEISRAEKILDYGFGELIGSTYDAVFEVLENG